MKLEKMINDTQEVSIRLYAPEVLGLWDPSALLADVVGEAGTLAHSVLTIEGIAPAKSQQLLPHRSCPCLEDLIREGYANLAMLENKGATMKND